MKSTLVCRMLLFPYTTMMWPTVIIIEKYSMRGDPLWNDRLVFCKMCKSSGVRTALLLVKGTNFQFHKRWSSIRLCESSAFDVAANDCTLLPRSWSFHSYVVRRNELLFNLFSVHLHASILIQIPSNRKMSINDRYISPIMVQGMLWRF